LRSLSFSQVCAPAGFGLKPSPHKTATNMVLHKGVRHDLSWLLISRPPRSIWFSARVSKQSDKNKTTCGNLTTVCQSGVGKERILTTKLTY
jgi:hypothetical protein